MKMRTLKAVSEGHKSMTEFADKAFEYDLN